MTSLSTIKYEISFFLFTKLVSKFLYKYSDTLSDPTKQTYMCILKTIFGSDFLNCVMPQFRNNGANIHLQITFLIIALLFRLMCFM